MSRVRVALADDHPIFRDGLKRMLLDAGIQVVAEAANGDEIVPMLESACPEVALLDIAMPGLGWLDVLGEIRDRNLPVRVVMLSAYSEREYAERALRAGAVGFVTKERTTEDLLTAINRVRGGGRYVSETLAQQLAQRITDGKTPDHQSLSDREFQVMQLMGDGVNITEIAERLGLSPKTISTYRERILEKLDLQSTADIIRYAIREGIVEP